MNQGCMATALGTANSPHCRPAQVVTQSIDARTSVNRTLSAMITGLRSEREVVRTGVDGLDDGDVAHCERRLAVRQVVAPLPDKALVEAELLDLGGLRAKRLAPLA